MAVLFSNNASSNLSASITSTATSLSVSAGTGAEFPNPGGSDYFYATLSNAAGNIEIIKVTARSTDTLTIVRGQDGTTARAWANSDKIELRLTAGGLSDLKNDTLALVNNGQLTVSAGSGLTGSGTFLANQSSNTSITISHADTSSQASVSNTGATVVQSVTVDGYGHVTAMASKTMGYADVGAPSTAGTNASGTWGISITGNAATATTLQTARTINGVSFNGSANIIVEPYVEDAVTTSATRYVTFVDNSIAGHKRLNEDADFTYNPGTNTLTAGTFSGALSGNAATATTLQTARTINGVSFNGSANITITAAASDVYAWAKASTKPSYTYSEVGAPSTTGTNASGTWGISITGNAATAGNADTTDGLHVHSGRNNEANKIVRTDGSGYIQAGWINSTSGSTTSTITRITASNDEYLRYVTPATFRSQITDPYYPTKTGGGASGTWGISITGNAATATTASNSNALGGLGVSAFMRDDGWNTSPGQDANTQEGMRSDFSYSNNAPHTGDLIRFGSGAYSLQLSSAYSGGTGFSFRTRNGDANTWNPWYQILHAGNYNSYAPTKTGGGASGTWGINITGSAGGVAWTNVSGRPTAVSSFSNDSGYITSSSLPNLGVFSTNGGQDFLGRGKRCIVATTSDMILNYGNDFSQVSVQSALTASGNISGNSDERLKADWQPVRPDFIECLALVRSGTFTRIDIGGRQAGSAAQDWQGLLPEVVSEGSDEAKTLSLAYGNAALVSAVELAKRVVSQDAKIARLEALIEKLIGE